ncbi:MAG: hypothetical protein M1825_003775 [Sarcosagium campestre]|nr:MAG: hypothetical protein M1825_003775 [Sarcosagium campestre]
MNNDDSPPMHASVCPSPSTAPTSPPSSSPSPPAENSVTQQYLLNDIFSSSRSPSPSLPDSTAVPEIYATTAVTTPSSAAAHLPRESKWQHPSDIPRLRTQHQTAGYREGVAKAKAASVQSGFDAGYVSGAELGVIVGGLLGVLEGITTAVVAATPNGDRDGDSSGLRNLLSRARSELASWQDLYEREFREQKGEGVYDMVVEKWIGIVRHEATRWGLGLDDYFDDLEKRAVRHKALTHRNYPIIEGD